MTLEKSLHWDITKKCNLRCRHCYNADKYFNTSSDIYMPTEMNYEQCMHTVEQFANAGFTHIHFLGGEPLASPHIFDIISKAKTFGMRISMNSNACLLTREVQEKLIALNVEQFAASLDGGTPETNDFIRGKGTFEKVVANMKQLNHLKHVRNSTLETALVFTLTQKNIKELRLLPALAYDIGVDLIVLTTFIESGQGHLNYAEFEIDFNTICDEIDYMVAHELIKYNIPLQIDMRPLFCDYLAAAHNAPIIYNPKNSMCCAGEEMWYLEADGGVHPCLIFQLESGKNAIDNGMFVKEDINIHLSNIEDIQCSKYWHTFLNAKHRFNTKSIPTCHNCEYANICQPCFLDYGTYLTPIPECEWVQKKQSKLFDNIINSKITLNKDITYDKGQNIISINSTPTLLLENDISTAIWHALVISTSPKQIIESLMQTYEVEMQILQHDICNFILTLKNKNIITVEVNS